MFKRKIGILIIIITSLIGACKQEATNAPYTDENGLLVEKVVKFAAGEDPYIADNKIYSDGKVFVFQYYYLTPDGDTMFYRSTTPAAEDFASVAEAWDLVSPDSADEKTVTQLSYTFVKGLQPFILIDSNFTKTVVEIKNYNAAGQEVDQKDTHNAVENAANVWLPQPRFKLFRLLELSPFPLIRTPYEKGKSWQWAHDIDEWWSDSRWGIWGGNVHNVCDYKITGKETLQTPFGALECWVVIGNTASNLGKSTIKAYFNENYGFVKMEYENVNKSKLVQTLEKINFNK